MNRIYILFLSLLISSAAFAGGKDIKVTVKGMVCGFCAQGITKKFKARTDVENIDVSLEKKTVLIQPKEGKDIPDDAISEILKDSGYTVEKIER